MSAQQQAEEGLRRARAALPAGALRCLLQTIADRLRDERPGDPMWNSTNDALALKYSEGLYGVGTALAEAAERQYINSAPRICRTAPITRGEYALVLDRIAAQQ